MFISGEIKQGMGQSVIEYQRTLNDSEGYSQTKYVPEQLALAAGRLCNEIAQSSSIYKDELSRSFVVIQPGYKIDDQVTGLSKIDDFIWKLGAGAVRFGSFPLVPPDYWLEIAEVTYVARLVLYQACLGAPNVSSGSITPSKHIHQSQSRECSREYNHQLYCDIPMD